MLQNQRIEQLNERIKLLEKLLLQLNSKQGTGLNLDKGNMPNDDSQVSEMNNTILDR